MSTVEYLITNPKSWWVCNVAGVIDPSGLIALLSGFRQRAKRERYRCLPDLRLVAGLSAVPRTGSPDRGLTQQDMDVLLGRPPGSFYSRLERGLIAVPPAGTLRRVAEILDLSEQEWGVLWLAVFGQQPSPSAALHPGEASAVPAVWRTVVETSPLPAYATDLGWDVLYCNAAARDLWGAMPKNILLWVLLERDAREAVMRDWASHWGPLAVSLLANAVREHPGHPRLEQVRELALEDDRVRRLWMARRAPYLHPDGDRRRIWHAAQRRNVVIESAVGEPKAAPGCRVTFLKCVPEYAPS
jgi:PAS domain-containing protein